MFILNITFSSDKHLVSYACVMLEKFTKTHVSHYVKCPLLFSFNQNLYVLVKLPSIKFYENLFSDAKVVTREQTENCCGEANKCIFAMFQCKYATTIPACGFPQSPCSVRMVSEIRP
jgi:hypothetical protein